MDAEKPPCRAYHFDRFILDLHRGALLALDGTELPLRPKSFTLLQLFVENAGRLLDRDTIMGAVWPDVFVTDDSITQCVGDIRRALGDEAQHLLRTIPRRGYLFATEVSHAGPVKEPPGEGPRASIGQPAPPPSAPSGNSTAQDRRDDSGEPVAHPDPEATPGLTGLGRQEPWPGSERRHLTVLACDLVNSTGLFEQIDPEDVGAIMHAFMERCAAVITGCGGHVATYTGDGVVAYFGYPHAREDAAERSVRAGLALVDAAATLETGVDLTLQLRVGIATGLVVNDRIGEGALGHLAVGRPLNLAARLQTLARPAAVVIADTTRCLVGGLFALEDLGCHALKGFTEPVRAWRVIGEGTAESRFEALRGARLASLVGRRHELSLLLDRWRQAEAGEGQVVLLSGEPGIGKSRLIQALRDGLAGEPHTYLGYYCSSFHQDSPLRPVIAQLERAACLSRSDDPAQKLNKLAALLAQGGDNAARTVPLVAPLLSIPSETCSPPLNITPQQQRARTLVALVDRLAGLAAHRPVLLVWEDVHWADPTSLELLGLVLDRLQDLPVLAVVSFRPEFVPPWPRHTHATWLGLHRLGRRRCGRLIAGLSHGKALPTVVMDQIMAKAEGVPLFVEELTKAVLESGLLRDEGDRYELDGSLAPLAIPETLQDSLMARLDRHAAVKELAQVGAVIGREFSHELLAAVVSWEEKDFDEALHRLVAAELIFPRGVGSEAAYVFKHALVQDAAYASLPRSKRRLLHARIAGILEDRFPRTAETDPEVLARHWTEAGEVGKAALYRLRAGERAVAHSATAEAIGQFTVGLDVLRTLPGPERDSRELDLQVALGAVLSAARGLAAPEAERAYIRARELCDRLGDERSLVPVLLGLWASHNARDELAVARAVASQLLDLARRNRDKAAGILGRRALGATLFGLGRFAEAKAELEHLLSLDDTAAGRLPVSLPYNPSVSGRAWLALTLAVLGYPDQALAQSDKALADADKLRHLNTTCLVLSLRCSVGQFLRDDKDVALNADALLTLAAGQGFSYWAGLGQYFQGWAQAWSGDIDIGIERTHQALEACQTTGAMAYVPYNLSTLAELHLRADNVAQGRKLLDMALCRLRATDARYCEAELLRLDGELRLAMPGHDRDGAEAAFKRALEIARGQEAKAIELRAAMSLARVWADDGKRRQARDLLSSVYTSFTEGFSTNLLASAKRMIDGLE